MAMQHYQKEDKPVVKQQARVGRDSVVGKYFHDVSEEFAEEKSRKRQLINQYASNIAERVMMREAANPAQQAAIAIAKKKKKVKENEIPGHSMGFTGGAGPGMGDYVVDESPLDFDKENPSNSTIHSHQGVNPASIEARIMRARGQLKELAKSAESNELIVWESIARHFPELAMNIEQIRHGIDELATIRKGGGRRVHNIPKDIGENVTKTIKPKKKTDPCWNDYHQVGVKMKNGKSVPNCVPKNK
jgi:hypothetical protein